MKNQDGCQKIILTYKRDIEKEKNIEKTIEKFSQNNEKSNAFKDLLKEWNSHLIDVKDGTIYEVRVEKTGTTMYIDNKKIYQTESAEFGEMYLKMWSGSNPVDEDLRDKMVLAKTKMNSALIR